MRLQALGCVVAAFLVAGHAQAQQCGLDEPVEMPATVRVSAPPSPWPVELAALVAALGVAGVLVVARDRRWKLASRTAWSPYLAGAGLGITATVSLAVFGKRLSSAGGYQQLAGWLGARLAPDNGFFQALPKGLTWELLVLVGMFAGAFVSALSGRELRLRLMPDAQWVSVFGPSVAKRWLLVFGGTALVQFAAGIAGGCTASLAVSGGGVAAPGAFVFMAGMFGGGIPVARWLYRRRT
jgi:uncharacterized protein